MSESAGSIIWIVEDDPSAQRIVAEALKTHGFLPVVFDSAEKAYSALAYQKLPVLIILDILLPGMSGVDLIRLLKQNKTWEKIPVVVVSVLSRNDSTVRESREAISTAYWFSKPYETDDLIRTLQGILTVVR